MAGRQHCLAWRRPWAGIGGQLFPQQPCQEIFDPGAERMAPAQRVHVQIGPLAEQPVQHAVVLAVRLARPRRAQPQAVARLVEAHRTGHIGQQPAPGRRLAAGQLDQRLQGGRRAIDLRQPDDAVEAVQGHQRRARLAIELEDKFDIIAGLPERHRIDLADQGAVGDALRERRQQVGCIRDDRDLGSEWLVPADVAVGQHQVAGVGQAVKHIQHRRVLAARHACARLQHAMSGNAGQALKLHAADAAAQRHRHAAPHQFGAHRFFSHVVSFIVMMVLPWPATLALRIMRGQPIFLGPETIFTDAPQG